MPDSTVTKLLEVATVAQELGIRPSQVHKLVRSGRLRAVQITARKRMIDVADLNYFIEASKTKPVDLRNTTAVISASTKGGTEQPRRTGRLPRTPEQLRKEMKSWH